MIKKTTLSLFLFGFVLLLGYAYQANQKVFDALVFSDNEASVILISSNGCEDPTNLVVTEITTSSVQIGWEAGEGMQWEYYLQEEGVGLPSSTGAVSTTLVSNYVTALANGSSLIPNTAYEFFVRTVCADGSYGEWMGPVLFRTRCEIVTVLPFIETFNTTSPTLGCWVNLTDSKASESWKISTMETYEGNGCMLLRDTELRESKDDHWLVSPSFKLEKKKVYELSFYYKTNFLMGGAFDLLVSKNGIDRTQFTTVLAPAKLIKTNVYLKEIYYLTDYDDTINIAWKANYAYGRSLFIDSITLRQVSCEAPKEKEIEVTELGTTDATFTWKDSYNTSWEYFVQIAGTSTKPTGSGTLVNTKKAFVTSINGVGGSALKDGTEYEFFVRGSCGVGKYSEWVGPIAFKTACKSIALPFWEGFNKDSETFPCWRLLNLSPNTATKGLLWARQNYDLYEGTHAMRYFGNESKDWLISPTFEVVATKKYRLRYHYKTGRNLVNYDVLLSTDGPTPTAFKTTLLNKRNHVYEAWKTETIIIGNITGKINIGWFIEDDNHSTLSVDNVFFEEISCAEPTNLEVQDVTDKEAIIFWSDEFGSNWEYYVTRDENVGPSGAGTKTTNTTAVVTTDNNGQVLKPNTIYKYYVRTDCGGGNLSDWSGPVKFRTPCGSIASLPFWEGFNSDTETGFCWTILDIDQDELDDINAWKNNKNWPTFEGDGSMRFSKFLYTTSDLGNQDWLISPTFIFETGKTYRLRFHYYSHYYHHSLTEKDLPVSNNFEVLASTTGQNPADFTKVLIPESGFKRNAGYEEKKIFITDIAGNVNLAWYVKGTDYERDIVVDNIFVEEVIGCPEPMNLTVEVMDKQSAQLSWSDNFGATAWEYVVQPVTPSSTIPIGAGIATTSKNPLVTVDYAGQKLLPNTEYEYYVRTKCADGTFSIWADPIRFFTLCDTYDAPFWEGFNSDSTTWKCWALFNEEGNYDATHGFSYEGDYGVAMYNNNNNNNEMWLISPTIHTTNELYVLKYHYNGNIGTLGTYEVVLSDKGVEDTANFTQQLLSRETIKHTNVWQEKTIFFTAPKGTSNIAWHLPKGVESNLFIDNVILKKVEGCPEPYAIKVFNQTTTTVDLEWQQAGGITNWEVLVVPYTGDENTTPIQKISVTGSPKTTLTGLSEATAYTVYIRAICLDLKSTSDWSTLLNIGTEMNLKNDCNSAIKLEVNTGEECVKTRAVSTFGLAASSIPKAPCLRVYSFSMYSIWFEFTATSSNHIVDITDITTNNQKPYTTFVPMVVYPKNCTNLDNPIYCKNFPFVREAVLEGLTPGQTYVIQVGFPGVLTLEELETKFTICITTPTTKYIEVSPSGDEYTANELVNKILLNSACSLATNVTYQAGDGNNTFNTLGYFNRGESDFPFEKGLVLATHTVKNIAGPLNIEAIKETIPLWSGDDDLNSMEYQLLHNKYVKKKSIATLEFDFIPIKDSLQFEYIFASDLLNGYSTEYFSDLGLSFFTLWVTDLETGITQNLALVPGTTYPISTTTIRTVHDRKYIYELDNLNSQFLDYYEKENKFTLPINYLGATIPMQSEKIVVKPGKNYHVKLAISLTEIKNDYEKNLIGSAVFLNAAGFSLGGINLGEDLLIETGTALCAGESKLIQTGISEMLDLAAIQWYKDDIAISGATTPDYEITEAGTYRVEVYYETLQCEESDAIVVEVYPALSTVVGQHKDLSFCRSSFTPAVVDLTAGEDAMFAKVDSGKYQWTYYLDKEKQQPIDTPTAFVVNSSAAKQRVYMNMVDVTTGCEELFEFDLVPTAGEMPTQLEDVKVCASYTLPVLKENQQYYSAPKGKGTAYKAGDVLPIGVYQLYVLQTNGDNCFEEVSFSLEVTEAPVLYHIEDQYLTCELFVLPVLPEYNKYYMEVEGSRVEVARHTVITATDTQIFVVAQSANGVCREETSFWVRYEDCPIPKGFSPNGDGINDTFDLSKHGVTSMKVFNRNGTEVYSFKGTYTNQWYGQSKGGKELPSGTYYYVVQAFNRTRTGWVELNR